MTETQGLAERGRSPKRSNVPKKADKYNDKKQPRPKRRMVTPLSTIREGKDSSGDKESKQNSGAPEQPDPRYHYELHDHSAPEENSFERRTEADAVEEVPLERDVHQELDLCQHQTSPTAPRRHIHWEDSTSPRGVVMPHEWSPRTSKRHFSSIRKAFGRHSAPAFLPPFWISEIEEEEELESSDGDSDFSEDSSPIRMGSISSTVSAEWEWPDITESLDEDDPDEIIPEFYSSVVE